MSMIFAAIGAGISALGKVKQGRDAKAAGDKNAAQMEAEAEYTRLKESLDLAKHKENVKKSMAETDLAYAKNGVRGTSGSVIDVQRENMNEALYDAEMIKLESEAAQRGYSGQASNYRTQGRDALGSAMISGAGDAFKFFGSM